MKNTITKMYTVGLLFSIIVFSQPLNAQVAINVKMDTNMMLIGDQTNITLEVVIPADYSVDFPVYNDTIIEKLEILDIMPFDTVVENDLLKIKQQYLVTSFDSGWYAIPPMEFVIACSADSLVDTLLSNPLYFGVMTMPLDSVNADSVTDIKAPIGAPLTFREVLPFASIGLGILLILFLVYFLYMKFARNEAIFVKKEKPKEPAHLIAFRSLDALKEAKLWQQGKNKIFYSQLTDIIRTYIEDRFGIYAMEMTTDEIIESVISESVLEKELKNELFDTLVRADFVKFAKATTLDNENELSIKFAYEFVIKTKLAEIIEEELDEEQDESQNQISQENR